MEEHMGQHFPVVVIVAYTFAGFVPDGHFQFILIETVEKLQVVFCVFPVKFFALPDRQDRPKIKTCRIFSSQASKIFFFRYQQVRQ